MAGTYTTTNIASPSQELIDIVSFEILGLHDPMGEVRADSVLISVHKYNPKETKCDTWEYQGDFRVRYAPSEYSQDLLENKKIPPIKKLGQNLILQLWRAYDIYDSVQECKLDAERLSVINRRLQNCLVFTANNHQFAVSTDTEFFPEMIHMVYYSIGEEDN